MKFAPLIWSNLKRKKVRTLLTVLSILVAFILFGLLSSINQALTGGVTMEGQNRIIVRHKVSIIQLLPASYKERMERIPGVSLATHQTWFGGNFQQEPKAFFMQNPVDPADFLDMHPEMLLSPEQKQRWLQTRTGAIVGRATADKFHWKVGDRVPITTPIWPKADGNHTWDFDIAGIYDGKEKNADTMSLFFRYDYFDEARQYAKGQVGWYTIRVKDPAQAAEIAKLVDREFENSDYETKTEPEAAFAQAWVKQVGNIALICASILGAVFFTILLVTGNTMSQAVRERTGELGVLKAIGFTNGQVVVLVMAEACLIAVLGGALGLALASLIIPVVGKGLSNMLPMFYFPSRDLLLGAALCLALGLVTGIFPALAAMRLRVAEALRRM
ncbi:MAG TPA: FtsX-like permease family protein [Candidatus Binatia bacterium]|jgi:putative ABC transport system permease protein|nr:FtsX-like permease family protein [Candidatus Binatia bacterium]